MTDKPLVDKFYDIVDGYYSGSTYFNDVEHALEYYEKIRAAVLHDSLAQDGMHMIEAVMREMEKDDE